MTGTIAAEVVGARAVRTELTGTIADGHSELVGELASGDEGDGGGGCGASLVGGGGCGAWVHTGSGEPGSMRLRGKILEVLGSEGPLRLPVCADERSRCE